MLQEIKHRVNLGSTVERLRSALTASLLALVSACGGGGGSTTPEGTEQIMAGDGTGQTTPISSALATDLPSSRAEAARFLTQATFGPTKSGIDRLMTIGYRAWIDEQFAMPQKLHLSYWNAEDAAIKALDSSKTALPPQMIESFYKQALTGPDQLRQRMAYALSQIFVVSLADSNLYHKSQGVADYVDLLGRNAFGNHRNLIEQVSRHPVMGTYLSHLHNLKEDPLLGRVPDENFAREVMQLFTIGLYQLNNDGSVKKDVYGHPLETYTAADIAGMAKVFSGWSWSGPDTTKNRFYGWDGYKDPARLYTLMKGYPQYHSTSEKKFLGKTVAAQPTDAGNAPASLSVAMDALEAHPNVGPFLGKQLIQRLVTSNPSPAYVARVAQVFNNNGAGVRGDMKAVIKAILLDNEARNMSVASSPTYGKVREPVLRLTAFLRAWGAASDSGKFIVGVTDNPGTQLAQSPLYSPAVFNFYRPGYVPPNTLASSAKLVVPEMQITHETSVAGYAEYLRGGLYNGFGQAGRDWKAARPDLQINYSTELALIGNPDALVDQVWTRLTGTTISTGLKSEIVAAVNGIVLPVLKTDLSNKTYVDQQKRYRVWTAIYLALVSPEFLIQK